jgi:REP element-mobilizing transposase RayT
MNYDYSQAGAYFVTVCTWQRDCLFGEIVNCEMVLNELGRVVEHEWRKTAELRPNVELDVYAIMPNHFHAIFLINDDVGAHCMRPESVANSQFIKSPTEYRAHVKNRAHIGAPLRRQSGSIGCILAGFKSATTKRINQIRANPGCPVWQRNYYERVIRNEHELARAREYIVNNPLKWELDKENPKHRI